MSDIHARKAHNLTLEEAKQTAQKLADQLQKEFQLDSQWQGNTLNFTRSGVKGKLDVTDKDVTVDISLGFMLKAFRGKIQAEIDKNIDKMFAGTSGPYWINLYRLKNQQRWDSEDETRVFFDSATQYVVIRT